MTPTSASDGGICFAVYCIKEAEIRTEWNTSDVTLCFHSYFFYIVNLRFYYLFQLKLRSQLLDVKGCFLDSFMINTFGKTK